MITLIYGGSGSGKSEYAEQVVLNCSPEGSRYYIATMFAYGEEGRKRVQRHRALRKGKGFWTIECPVDIQTALNAIPDPENATVLLECISNLIANEMFSRETSVNAPETGEQIVSRVMAGLAQLCNAVKNIVIVSDNVFDDGTDYEPLTVQYMEILGKVNCRIAKTAGQVIEVAAGIPIPL